MRAVKEATAAAAPVGQTPIDELRLALGELFGAERRLRAREHVEGRELTQSQYRALRVLQRTEEVTAGELARSADLNPASVTAMLDHLETRGVIERRRGTTDRRVSMVSLSPTGRDIIEAAQAVWQARWEEAFGVFSDEELGAALRVIRSMTQVIDRL